MELYNKLQVETTFSQAVSYTLTTELRIFYPTRGCTESRLQQMWQGSDGTQKWEDIKQVYGDELNES